MVIKAKLTFVFSVALLLASCGVQQAVQDASGQVNAFHRELDDQNYTAIWAATAPQFRSVTTQAQFMKMLLAIHNKLGKIRQFKQVGWNTNVNTNGHFTSVVMDTGFEKGTGRETFTYVEQNNDLKLAGYFINSADMMTN